jgi:SOS response regulatory protein OraA/RecX
VGGSPAKAAPTPLDIATKVLARAPRTEAELAARLERIGYSAARVAATVARCRELRYVDDAAVAMDRARTLRARGAGSLRIATELEARGVPDVLIGAALEESLEGEGEIHWAERALARQRIDVRDPHVRARAWRLLAARGFPEDVIADVVPDGD